MKKVLVIDDDMTFVATMKAALDPKKYTVTSAGNGEEGLKEVEASRPDLILLDIMMPKMDGLEFLKQMNGKFGNAMIPILITSNVSSLEKISEGVSLGIQGYFVKSNESLKSIIEMVDRTFA